MKRKFHKLIVCAGSKNLENRIQEFVGADTVDIRGDVDFVIDLKRKDIPDEFIDYYSSVLLEFCPYTIYFKYEYKSMDRYKNRKPKKSDNIILEKKFWTNIYLLLKPKGEVIMTNFSLFEARQKKKRGVSYEDIFLNKLETECGIIAENIYYDEYGYLRFGFCKE